MSAFLVSKTTIDCIVTTALVGASDSENWHPYHNIGTTRVDLVSASKVGAILWLENLVSVLTRYPRDKSSDHENTEGYRFVAQPKVSTAQAIKLLDCYAYQACEHDGWETSISKKFCDDLKGQLCCRMPGYDDAKWGV